jgi:hypothetical protein
VRARIFSTISGAVEEKEKNKFQFNDTWLDEAENKRKHEHEVKHSPTCCV